MGFKLGEAVIHIYSKKKGMVVANSDSTPNVVVQFSDGEELVHSAELSPSDHIINPAPEVIADRLNTLLEDDSTREVASKEFGLPNGESLMNVDYLENTHEMELTALAGTKISLKKVSVKNAKQSLSNIENQVS